MELNPYGLCPCLSGEKLKFCCPRELHAELGRIIELIVDSKLVVARETLQRLSQRFPRQHCLVAAELVLDTLEGNTAGVRKNLELLQQIKPSHGAILHAEVLLAALEGDPKRALACLNRFALWRRQMRQRTTDGNPVLTIPAADLVAHLCLQMGIVFPVFMLKFVTNYQFLKQVAEKIDEEDADAELFSWRMGLTRDDRIPLAIRDQHRLRLLLQLLRLEQQEIFELVKYDALLEAVAKASAEKQQHPEEPEWLYIVGVLAGAVLEDELAAECLRLYGQHPAADESWAVSALLLAEALSPRDVGVPVREYRLLVGDVDRLMETLLSEPRFEMQPLGDWNFEEGPPPKGQFLILDRPRHRSTSETVTPDEWPRVLGWIKLFGKQTDQPAHAMVQVIGDETEQFLRQCVGQYVVEPWQLLGQVHLNPMHDGWVRPRIPPAEISLPEYLEKLAQVTKQDILQTWIDFPHPLLDGLTPRQASVQDRQRGLVAALLHVETSLPAVSLGITVDELWDELKLPRYLPEDGHAAGESPNSGLLRTSIFWWLRRNFRLARPQDLVTAARFMTELGGSMAARLVAVALERADEMPQYHSELLACAMTWIDRLQNVKARAHYLREVRRRFYNVGDRETAAVMIKECEALAFVDEDQLVDTVREYEQKFGHNRELVSGLVSFLRNLQGARLEPDAQPSTSAAAPAAPQLWTPDQQAQQHSGQVPKLWVPGS